MTRMTAGRALRATYTAMVASLALAASGAVRAGAQSGSVLHGRVAGADPGRPLRDAEVRFDSLKLRARTDSTGSFQLVGIPAGRHAVEVRHPGYALLDTVLTFTGRDTLTTSFLLDDAADTVDATAVKMAQFERRRERGLGWFITRDDIDDGYDRELSEVLRRRIPGIALNRNRSNGVAVASARGFGSMTQQSAGDGFPPACYVQVYVDGVRIFGAGEGQNPVDINDWRPSDIEGIEFYPGMQQTPAEFSGRGASCGTLALWLRVL